MKLAIVASSGGMRSSYSVGVLLAIAQIHGITQPDILIGSSGSTGTLAYFTSGQFENFRVIWEQLLSTHKFINFRRLHKIMDIDYLIDDVFKKQKPLDTHTIYASPINLQIAVTNYASGQLEYFTNKDGTDLFESLRASKAALLVYGKKIRINNSQYIDGGLTGTLDANVNRALELGATHIIAIDNTPHDLASELVCHGYAWTHPRFKKSMFKKYESLVAAHVLVVRPSQKLPVEILTNVEPLVRHTIDIGFRDGKNLDLNSFLQH